MFSLNAFNPISLLATAALGPMGGILSQLASQVLTQVVDQIVQQTGERLALGRGDIDAARDLNNASRGSEGRLNDALSAFGEHVGASPSDIGRLQRDTADAIRFAAIEASQSEEAREARAGGKGGSWLLAMARALGAAADRKAEKLEAMSAGLDKAKPSETAEFQAETQEFNLLMSAMTSTIKGIGEAMTQMAKRN